MDHSTPTTPRGADGKIQVLDSAAAAQIAQLETNCRDFGIELHALGTEGQGIVHVIGPELGVTQPGMTIVCGDSHTSTHGAFGALAFGIGTSEVVARAGDAVPAAAASRRRWPSRVDGTLQPGVTAKDLILAVIARLGIGGGTGHVIEYRGSAIRALVDGRAHDRLQHVDRGGRARRHDRARRDDVRVPGGPPARAAGRGLGSRASPTGARCPATRARPTIARSASTRATLEPMITYGTNPGMGIPIARRGADRPTSATDARRR